MKKLLCLLAFGCTLSAHAWDVHQSLMPWVLAGLPPEIQKKLSEISQVPCPSQDQETLKGLVKELQLNPETDLPPLASEADCKRGEAMSARQVLLGKAVDEPDFGMDKDLPSAPDNPETLQVDPNGDRPYMGGIKGPTSQGFRHMYFGGWKWEHPVASFQIPARPMGRARERAAVMAAKARELLKSGNTLWGYRVLAWAMHYAQDLSQPFHSTQVVTLRIVPWDALMMWPPKDAFANLVRETTRTVSNYHYALEGYALEKIRETSPGDGSPLASCLTQAEAHSQIEGVSIQSSPFALADSVAAASRHLAPWIGSTEYKFFGSRFMLPGVDIPNGKGAVDYKQVIASEGSTGAAGELNEELCLALANGIHASRILIEWALR